MLLDYNEDSIILGGHPVCMPTKLYLNEIIKVDDNPRDLEPLIHHAAIYGDNLYLTLEWYDEDGEIADRSTVRIPVDNLTLNVEVIDAP